MPRIPLALATTTLCVGLAAGSAYAWVETFTGKPGRVDRDQDAALLVAAGAAGDVVTAGRLERMDRADPRGPLERYVAVSRRDAATGKERWRRVFASATLQANGDCFPECTVSGITLDGAGDVVLGGSLRDDLDSNAGFGAVKLDGATGALVWGWNGFRFGAVYGTAFDSQGDVLLSGSYGGDMLVVKVDGGTGTLLWQYQLAGTDPAPADADFGFAAAVEPNDDAVVAGSTVNTGTGTDATAVRLDAATGLEVWRTVLADAGVTRAEHVSVAGGGDVVMASRELTGAGAHVHRLAAATGAEVWTQPFAGTTGAGDVVNAVAVDAAEDVLAAGVTANTGTGDDFTVLKLDGATGAELWRVVLDGGGADEARGLFLPSDGTVLATGALGAPGTGTDLVAVAIDGATGTVLRTHRVDGTAHGDDAGNAVVMDGAGRLFVAGEITDLHRAAEDADFAAVGLAEGLSARKLQVLDRGSSSRLTLQVRDPLLLAAAPGSPADPTIGGATLELSNPISGEQAVYPLPAAGWRARVGRRLGKQVYTYRDRERAFGPCTSVVVASGKRLAAGCRGDLGFTLDEPAQVELQVRLTTGSGAGGHCTAFAAPLTDEPGKFLERNAPAPVGCP